MLTPLAGRYAAVAATLALLVSVGGTSYAAVLIGTNQIKNNAVTSAKVKPNTLTGADVNESSLTKVPQSQTAQTAQNAGNAAAVNGSTITKIAFRAGVGEGPTVVVDKVGLVVTANCGVAGVTLVATTTVAASFISSTVGRDSAPGDPLQADRENSSFGIGDTFDLLAGEDGDTSHIGFAYSAPDGAVVIGAIDTDEYMPDCLAVGFATAG